MVLDIIKLRDEWDSAKGSCLRRAKSFAASFSSSSFNGYDPVIPFFDKSVI